METTLWQQQIYALLTAYFTTQPKVMVAYLFGSQATGQARPDSDVDVAVLLAETDTFTRFEQSWQFSNEIEQIIYKSVDVVVLNDAPPLLVHHILLQKKLLFERDINERVKFEVRAGKIYADLQPMYQFFQQMTRQRIKAGILNERHHQWHVTRTLEQARNLPERIARLRECHLSGISGQ